MSSLYIHAQTHARRSKKAFPRLIASHPSSTEIEVIFTQMARWVKPEVYPLMAAMTFVTGMCLFQLTRNMFLNPDVRINKAHRTTAVLENAEEGQKYSQHGFRKFLSQRRPEVMPALNSFFSDSDK